MRSYNRSQEYKLLNKCAQSNKIVLADSNMSVEKFSEQYKWLLYNVHVSTKT